MFFILNSRLCAMTHKAVTLYLLTNCRTSVSDDLNVRKGIGDHFLGGGAGVKKLAIFSGQGALQLFFFVITFLADVYSNVNPSSRGFETFSLIASLTIPSHGAEGSPLPSSSHNSFQKSLGSLTGWNVFCSSSPFLSFSWS